METSPTQTDLLEALSSLRAADHSLAQETQQPFAGIPIDNPRLKLTIESFPERAAKRRPVPEDYKQQWQDFIEKRRDSLEARATGYLCWEPDIATDRRFQKYLDGFQYDLSARSLQGLVRSCHARWSSDFAGSKVTADVRRRLYRSNGANRVIAKWKEGLSLVLGSKATSELATWMLVGRKPIKEACEFWKLEEQSSYLLQAIEEAAAACLKKIGEHSAYNRYIIDELIAWNGWPIDRFKKLVSVVIECTFPATEFAQALKPMVLGASRLGDPRLPLNSTNWLGVSPTARNSFIEWLSKDDIVFFFELGLPKGADPHGRKQFWLNYVGSVKKSRPLLCDDDRARLQNAKEKVGNFGRIVGETSAFLLDFGTVIAVEFSKSGNACYIYEKPAAEKVIPDFWRTKSFFVSDLKSKQLSAEVVTHHLRWQEYLERILAQKGVRQRMAS
jgi:hypothetical protein